MNRNLPMAQNLFIRNILPPSLFTTIFHDPLHVFLYTPENFLARTYIKQKTFPQMSTKSV